MRKSIVSAIVVSLSALGLTGCVPSSAVQCDYESTTAPKSVPQELAAVIAPTNTFVELEEATAAAQTDVMDHLTTENTQFATVLADGAPSRKTLEWVAYPDLTTDVDKPYIQEDVYGTILYAYDCAVAGSDVGYRVKPESDLLGALGVAADSFTHEGSSRTVFVLSNGIQTAGQINFATDFPSLANNEATVESLRSQNALPDLSGVSVSWYGMGQVDGVNQLTLNQQSLDALEDFWTKVIAASGGSLDKVVRQITQADPLDGAIPQSSVTGVADACIVTLDEDSGFSFKPDESIFVNKSVSLNAAENVITELAANPNCSGALTVTGFAASGVDEDAYNDNQKKWVKTLSLDRANAFKRLLEEAGFNGKIVTVGGGKGTVNDWDSSGKFVESLGKKNRIVTISQGGN